MSSPDLSGNTFLALQSLPFHYIEQHAVEDEKCHAIP